MKPHLPLTLLSALLVLGASLAPAATVVNPSPSDYTLTLGGYSSYVAYKDSALIVNDTVLVPWNHDIDWDITGQNNTLSGGGTIICTDHHDDGLSIFFIRDEGNVPEGIVPNITIDGVNFDGVDLYVPYYGSGCNLVVNDAYIKDSCLEGGGTWNLTNATLRGETELSCHPSTTILPPGGTLNLSAGGTHLEVVYGSVTIQGNVTLSGIDSLPTTAEAWSDYAPLSYDTAYGQPCWGTLTIEGTLTLASPAAISFDNYGNSDVVACAAAQPVIVCDKLIGSPDSIGAYIIDYDAKDGDGVYYESNKRIEGYGFQAVTGDDGLVYIFLTANGVTPVAPTHIAHEAANGNTIILSGDDVIATDSMVKLNGGNADVSAVNSPLTNAVIIGTSAGGSLITADTQQVDFTKSGDVNYALSGKGGHAAAAMMVKNDVNLRGSRYDSDKITVERGVLTVGEKTTLGRGNASQLLVKSKATNMGNVAAHTVVEQHAAVLNMGMMSGDVDLKNGAVLTNNATVKGRVVAEGGSSVFGTGSFADTLVQSGAHLHVGNSPGYQHHASLTLQRGSNLSFSVDGVTPATLTQTGSGTHSRMVADKLTLSGTPAVTVEVTMGYVHDLLAGKNGTVTLMSVGSGDSLTALKDAVTIHDTTGYLEDLQVYADAAELSISAVLNEAADELRHSQKETEVVYEPSADTMWASRDIVRSFAQTAEGQMIIGTPGQTTVWGAALGSFVHMSRSTGFVAENGGGAIGVQHAFTEQFRAGAAFGQTFGSFRTKESYMNADQRGTMLGAVAQYVGREQNGVSASLNGHIAIGSVRNEAKFNSAVSNCGKSSWDDRVLSLGTRASLWMNPSTDVTLVPFIGLEYQRVIQGHHTESDGTYSVRYSGGAMQTLSLPVGVTLRTQCTLPEGETLVPEITLAYEGDVVRQNPHVTVRETGATGRCKGTGSKPGRSALRLDAGVNLLIDAQWSVGAFYHLEARKDATSHSCNAAVRYSF